MSNRPKRSTTYKGHPGQIVNDAKQTRRSKEEVEAEKAEKMAKKVELEAQKQEAIARRTAGVKRVAAKEDEIQLQVATARQNATRPDKVAMDAHQEHLKRQKEREALSKPIPSAINETVDDEMVVDDEQGDDGFDTDDQVDFPPVSILDSSSERGLSEPINNYGDESEEGDKDYVNNQSGEDGENSVDEAVAAFLKERAAKKKKEKKPERVSLLL